MSAGRILICTAAGGVAASISEGLHAGVNEGDSGARSRVFQGSIGVCSGCGGVLTLIPVPCTRKAGVCPRTNRVPGRLPGG